MSRFLTLTELENWLDENSMEYKEYTVEVYSYDGEIEDPEMLPVLGKNITEDPPREKRLIIKSKNGKRDLELEFTRHDSDYVFFFMWFGNYFFDINNGDFDIEDAAALFRSLIQGDKKFVCGYGTDFPVVDISDIEECYDMTDPVEEHEFQSKRDRIHNGTQGIYKIVGDLFVPLPQKYEIYDWNTYECIEME